MSTEVCPYCRMPVEFAPEMATAENSTAEPSTAPLSNAIRCPVCHTPHHQDCWDENGGCTVFGCSAAPVEEATVRVDSSDFAHDALPGSANAHAPYRYSPSADPSSGLDSTGVPPPPPTMASFAPEESPIADPNGNAFPLSPISSHTSVERRFYVLLAVVCGFLGAHNLYANRTSAGIIQLCTTTLTCFLALPVTWIWALIEAATIDHDGDGLPMV